LIKENERVAINGILGAVVFDPMLSFITYPIYHIYSSRPQGLLLPLPSLNT